MLCGDGTKRFILEDADIYGFDLMIAVKSKDADNLVICLLAKKIFGIRRAFATVNNPSNIEVFKKLGINTAVSATYVLANIIEQMASVPLYSFLVVSALCLWWYQLYQKI